MTGRKLSLSRAVALREADQAQLALLRQRYALFTTVRQGYFEVSWPTIDALRYSTNL